MGKSQEMYLSPPPGTEATVKTAGDLCLLKLCKTYEEANDSKPNAVFSSHLRLRGAAAFLTSFKGYRGQKIAIQVTLRHCIQLPHQVRGRKSAPNTNTLEMAGSFSMHELRPIASSAWPVSAGDAQQCSTIQWADNCADPV